MIARIITFLIVFLLLVGVVAWIVDAFKQEAFIEDSIERIEVYDAESTTPANTISDADQIDDILDCINACEREELVETALFTSIDVTLILYGKEEDYNVGVMQSDGAVRFTYDNNIISSAFEPFAL
ncbi:hypothetical protein SFC66_12665 [Terribacillus saccharophilus]|uniref:hypothetical protein n=1 Tax=Terribacillus saccharophilus TaxID=361277 RepID=UPI0039822F3D